MRIAHPIDLWLQSALSLYGCLRARAEPISSVDPLVAGRGVPQLVDDWEWRGVEVGVGEDAAFHWVGVVPVEQAGELIGRLALTRFAEWRFCMSARGILVGMNEDHSHDIARWYEKTGIVGIERTSEYDAIVDEFLDVASDGLRRVPDPWSVARRWTTFVVRHSSLGADRILPRLGQLQSRFVERALEQGGGGHIH